MRKVTSLSVAASKGKAKITMLTAYDATFASIFDASGVDILLVGDSMGMVIQGHDTTLPVTLDQAVYHTAAVSRVTKFSQVVGDLPFMSYQVSPEQALESAGRLVKEGGCSAVKLEGGAEMAPTIKRVVAAGIPVMGHIGLTPQSVHRLGGFKIQGRDSKDAMRLFKDAQVLADAGCYAIVLECIPADLAKEITDEVKTPTIGIGAGPHCDGQVLVCYDMLGMNPSFQPKFVKRYVNLFQAIGDATSTYLDEVKGEDFPTDKHSF